MTHFIFIATLLTALAVIAVLVPLLKDGRGRWTALLITVVVPAGTTLLYGYVSNWNWQAAPAAVATNSQDQRARDVAAVAAALERRLSSRPKDIDAWVMLGRAYLAVGNIESAVNAFSQAQLAGRGQN